jgi:mannose-1-phosphate guanylyltransferase
MKFLITAGGQGTKMWPYSRVDTPKQFQSISGQSSMMRATVDLLLTQYNPEDIIISTKEMYVELSKQQLPEIPAENYIVEPDYRKNRGPGEGLAFLILSIKHPDEPFMIIQPDLVRTPESKFLEFIQYADEIVSKDRKMIMTAIKANNPALGVDYIQVGERKYSNTDINVYSNSKFVDRSDSLEVTQELTDTGKAYFHWNHLCWYPSLMLESYKKYKNDWYKSLMEIKKVLGKNDEKEQIDRIYSDMDKGATEIVMREEMKNGYVMTLPFKCFDTGTWLSVYDIYSEGNSVLKDGLVVDVRTKNSIIKGDPEKLIATLDVQNLIIIDTKDALLVANKSSAGKIDDVLEEIKKNPEGDRFL